MSLGNTIQASVYIDGIDFDYPVALAGGLTVERTLGLSPNFVNASLVGNYVANIPGGVAYPIDGPTIATDATASLTIADGLGASMTLADLTVHEVSHSISPKGGRITNLVLKDARWRNKFGSITGEYNIPDDGPVVEGQTNLVTGTLNRRRTVQQLVGYLFDAMGVAAGDRDLTALDDFDWYPPVRWEFATPAVECERLLNEIGMAVAFKVDGKYRVVVLGDIDGVEINPPFLGGTVPKRTNVSEFTDGQVYVVGSRIVIEERLRNLVPCGVDVDGGIKALHQLRYAPNTDAPTYGGFSNINADAGAYSTTEGSVGISRLKSGLVQDGEVVPPEVIEGLAEQSIWRMYRFDGFAEEKVRKLPWLQRIVQTDDRNGKTIRREPMVYVRRSVPEAPAAPAAPVLVSQDKDDLKYTIDFDRGIITFSEPVYLHGATGEAKAGVDIRVAYESVWWDQDPGGPVVRKLRDQDYYIYPAPPGGTIPVGATIVRRPELVLYRIINDDGLSTDINIEELDEFAQTILDGLQYDQAEIVGGDATFPRLVQVDPNGAYRQVVWSVGGGGFTTSIICNNERANNRTKFLTYNEKLEKGAIRRALDKFGAGWTFLSPDQDWRVPATAGSSGEKFHAPSLGAAAHRGRRHPCYSTVEIPQYSFAEIDVASNDSGIVKVKQPTNGMTGACIGVIQSRTNATGFSTLAMTGMARVQLETPGSVTAGQYVDPKPGAWTAIPGQLFKVLRLETLNTTNDLAVILLPFAAGRKQLVRVTNVVSITTINPAEKNRFIYTISQVRIRQDAVTGIPYSEDWPGTTLSAFAWNVREIFNTPVRTVQASTGVDQGGANYPAGFNVRPIPVGAIVEYWVEEVLKSDGTTGYLHLIGEPTADDGTCT